MKVQRGCVTKQRMLATLLAVSLITVLDACSGGGSFNISNSQKADPATNDYPIFYVKRTIPTMANINAGADDVRMLRVAFPSADLYMRASASPAAAETNITARITAGAMWDVKDVDTSADGSRVAFAMRGPLMINHNSNDPP